MYAAKIIADSINPVGCRLTTFEVTYPRIVHNELMTHRDFSRNSSSSRAIPNSKLIQKIKDDPFIPIEWGKNQKGMQAGELLEPWDITKGLDLWIEARNKALEFSEKMSELGVHKQIVNRLLEPWMWITVIISATNYENFFALRCHHDAQPEIRKIAEMMRELYRENVPTKRTKDGWHLPYIKKEDWEDSIQLITKDRSSLDIIRAVCIARCARVSYLTHDGIRDLEKDWELFLQLFENKHFSPFEHGAKALETNERIGNFNGWKQFRKEFKHEYITMKGDF